VNQDRPAFDFITVASLQGGGIESPFVSNTKYLLKYNLSNEIIQACKNAVDEAVAQRKIVDYHNRYYV